MFIHLTLVPYIGHAGELKTKPTQHSVNELRRIGIAPGHADVPLGGLALSTTSARRSRCSRACPSRRSSRPATSTTSTRCRSPSTSRAWTTSSSSTSASRRRRRSSSAGRSRSNAPPAPHAPCKIALVGKYVQLEDAYLSVSEALRHAASLQDSRVEIDWIDSESSREPRAQRGPSGSRALDGILIPGGFGGRGIEGKIAAARASRASRQIPYLGICLGMQVAVAEFARNVAGMEGANSTEFDIETPYPVIDLLPEQKEVADLGGTMRLGADPIKLHDGHARAGDVRRGRHLRAPPPPLRGQQPAAQAPARTPPGLRDLRHLARRAPGRGDRARASTRSSSPRSSTPSSSRAPSARRRCSAGSSPPRSSVRASDARTSVRVQDARAAAGSAPARAPAGRERRPRRRPESARSSTAT